MHYFWDKVDDDDQRYFFTTTSILVVKYVMWWTKRGKPSKKTYVFLCLPKKTSQNLNATLLSFANAMQQR